MTVAGDLERQEGVMDGGQGGGRETERREEVKKKRSKEKQDSTETWRGNTCRYTCFDAYVAHKETL